MPDRFFTIDMVEMARRAAALVKPDHPAAKVVAEYDRLIAEGKHPMCIRDGRKWGIQLPEEEQA